MTNPYQVLEVNPNADDQTIKRQYRKLIKIYHPDNNINNPNKAKAEEKFKEIQSAYELIMRERSGDYTCSDYRDYADSSTSQSSTYTNGGTGGNYRGNSNSGTYYYRNTGSGSSGNRNNNSGNGNNNNGNNNTGNGSYGNRNGNTGNSGYYNGNNNTGNNGYYNANNTGNNGYHNGYNNTGNNGYYNGNSNTGYGNNGYYNGYGYNGGNGNYYGNPNGGGAGYGFRGGNNGNYYDTRTNYRTVNKDQNDDILHKIAEMLNRAEFQDALNVLDAMEYRSDVWFYYSAIANTGLGNNIRALNDAQTALQMNPNTPEYNELVNNITGNAMRYRDNSTLVNKSDSDKKKKIGKIVTFGSIIFCVGSTFTGGGCSECLFLGGGLFCCL